MDPTQEKLKEKALDLLNFPAICNRVAEHARFFASKNLANKLLPSYDAHEVQNLHKETAEGIAFLNNCDDINIGLNEDPSSLIRQAVLEGTLKGLELLKVADLINVLSTTRSMLSQAPTLAPTLFSMAARIPDLNKVQKRIRKFVGGQGEVLDSATPVLGPLRSNIIKAYQQVTISLDMIVQSKTSRAAMQDDVISIRGDRLVLQVKKELRHRVPGIVHDVSNTGSTLFIEPFDTIDLCNKWRELVLEEKRITSIILRGLSTLVSDVASNLNEGIRLVARLDLVLAKARYSIEIDGVSVIANNNQTKHCDNLTKNGQLIKARHPLLGTHAVPINISIGPEWSVLIITGPNTGGKTVAMKTFGLLSIMNQVGLQIPAESGSFLTIFDGIYIDIGDNQSIENSVSAFSSRLRNIVDILSYAGPHSLVLLDELGTSTAPEEGTALAQAILGHLADAHVFTIATTHFRAVATYAEGIPGMMNASVNLDPSTSQPTYVLALGMPGRSHAMAMASSLGLSPAIVKNAQSLLEPQYLRLEKWINELQYKTNQVQTRLEQIEKAEIDVENAKNAAKEQLSMLNLERENILNKMHSDLASHFDDVRKKLKRAESSLSWRTPQIEDIEAARINLSKAIRAVKKLNNQGATRKHTSALHSLAAGDRVEIRGLGIQGTIKAMVEQNTKAEVAVGQIRLTLDLGRLIKVNNSTEPDSTFINIDLGPPLSSAEIDLRGYSSDDALVKTEEFLDKALRDNLTSVRIIHGLGTGTLRSTIRGLLENHPLAKSFTPEDKQRGGDGVTIVILT